MKNLTSDQSKIDLVARLVKEGHIDFVEAIKLLEVQVEKEYIYYPAYPNYPTYPSYPTWTTVPFVTTYDDTTTAFTLTTN